MTTTERVLRSGLLFLLAPPLAACPGDDDDSSPADDDDDDSSPADDDDSAGDDDDSVVIPDVYDFESRFGEGSSVAYGGQTFRQALVEALKGHVGGLTARLDGGWFPEAGEVVAELDFYFEFDASTSGELPHGIATTPPPLQETWNDLGSANLVAKIAGNDAEGQHEDWSTAFAGWDAGGVTTPESLVRAWFQQLEDQAIAWSNGAFPLDPDGNPVASVNVTPDGHDLKELLQKFLLAAIAFSQGSDDYLDDDLPGAGLLSDNVEQVPDKPYTALEHAWDEGFGYFGAARDYGDYSDQEVNDGARRDTLPADGAIDLQREYNWGHSTNASKRDLGSNAAAPTDFSGQAWEALLAGRALITAAGGALDAGRQAELAAHRDAILAAWEGAVAATVVHYVNELLVDTAAVGTDGYSFASHAKHWSEMKGFALAFQFNPRSALDDAQFEELHGLLGMGPALAGDDLLAYAADLLAARDLLQAAFGFDDLNMGDDGGAGGW